WVHPGGLLPRIRLHPGPARRMAIKVESVVDFLAAERLSGIEIYGPPLASFRSARVAAENDVEVWIVERHGSAQFIPNPQETPPMSALLRHQEAFRLRRRDYDSDEAGFAEAMRLVDSAIADLGRDRTCDLFFAAEREYWLRRNRAGQIQKARQDALGL